MALRAKRRHRLGRPADVDVDRVPLRRPVDVVLARAPDRPDRGRERVLEDQHVARDPALGGRLPDDGGGIEPGLRPGALWSSTITAIGCHVAASGLTGSPVSGAGTVTGVGSGVGPGVGAGVGSGVGAGVRRVGFARPVGSEAGPPGGDERTKTHAAADREDDEQAEEGPSGHPSGRRAAGFGHVAPLAASIRRGGAQNSGAIPGRAPAPMVQGWAPGRMRSSRYARCPPGRPPSQRAPNPPSRPHRAAPAGRAAPASPSRSRRRPPTPDQIAGPSIEEDGSWVQADAVEVHQGAIGRVDATDVSVTQGAIGAARADRVSVQMGGLGAAMGREVSISQGGAGSILAGQARIEQSFVRTLVAQQVEIHRPSAVLFLIAQRVSGDVRPLLDWRGALALGAAFGILAGLFGRGRRGG